MSAKKFRKKPVVIEAVQWNGFNTEEISEFFGKEIEKVKVNLATDRLDLLIPTLEGQMRASVDDWIIKGVKGEFYPCKPDIFAATYEEASFIKLPESDHPMISAARHNAIKEAGAGVLIDGISNVCPEVVYPQVVQWFKNGDHPDDYSKDHRGFENGELRTFTAGYRKANEWEGDVVRYFRHPQIDGSNFCHNCGKQMNDHGWIDSGGDGQTVCPGDKIMKDSIGNYHNIGPDGDAPKGPTEDETRFLEKLIDDLCGENGAIPDQFRPFVLAKLKA